LYIYIKGVLFLPIRLQHHSDMLLMLGDSHIAVFGPIAPICRCATLAPPLVPWFQEDRLVLKGIHPRMNPL